MKRRDSSAIQIDENELVFFRIKRNFINSCRVFANEVYENYQSLQRLIQRTQLLYSYCAFLVCLNFQYLIERLAEVRQKYEKYEYSISTVQKILHFIHRNTQYKNSMDTAMCICSDEDEIADIIHFKRKYVEYYLKRLGVSKKMNIYSDARVLIQTAKSLNQTQGLDHAWLERPRTSTRDWTLSLKSIAKIHPKIFQHDPLLNCVSVNGKLEKYHIVEVLYTMFCAKRSYWRRKICDILIQSAILFERFLKPNLEIFGSGIKHAVLSHFNELTVKSKFPRIKFSVQLISDSGEIWTETSDNAVNILSLTTADGFSAVTEEISVKYFPVLQIHRLSQNHFKVLFKPRDGVPHKIFIRAGNTRTRNVAGSPFAVHVEIKKQSLKKMEETVRRRRRKSSFLDNEAKAKSVANSVNKKLQDVTEDDTTEEEEHNATEHTEENTNSFTKVLKRTFSIFTFLKCVFISFAGRDRCRRKSSYVNVAKHPHSKNYLNNVNGLSSLSVPQSRVLRIKSVKVIRFLNRRMPTINEYFFGDEYKENFQHGSPSNEDQSKRRWSNISELLRQKVRKTSFQDVVVQTMSGNKRRGGMPKQRRSSSKLFRDDGEENWHDKYRNYRRRKSSVKIHSSSSSENETDETKPNDIKNNNSLKTRMLPPRFEDIFESQDNAADYFLNSTSENHIRSKELSIKTIKYLEEIVKRSIYFGTRYFIRNISNKQR